MLSTIKASLKQMIARRTSSYVKKSLLSIWLDGDDDFWIHGKIVFNGNDDLYRKRFLWYDLDEPLAKIRTRFGMNKQIFLLTDRTDFPPRANLTRISVPDLRTISTGESLVVICAFESDIELLQAISIINKLPNSFYYCPFRYVPTARYFHRNELAHRILRQELELNLGKFDLGDFENIIQAIEITKGIEGDYVEIGVYRGDSAHAALRYMKESNISRKCYFFDLFEGFTNESSVVATDATWLDSHVETSLLAVQKLLADFHNTFVSKLDIVADELPSSIQKIAVCNIDVDIYEAVRDALHKVAPLIATGGIIILEDQGHTPYLAGAFVAAAEFMNTTNLKFAPIHMSSGQMLLVKY